MTLSAPPLLEGSDDYDAIRAVPRRSGYDDNDAMRTAARRDGFNDDDAMRASLFWGGFNRTLQTWVDARSTERDGQGWLLRDRRAVEMEPV